MPPDGVDPVKLSAGAAAASAKPLPPAQRRAATPDLFDFDLDDAARAELAADPGADDDDEEDKGGVGDVGMDDDWILDDLGGGMDDEEEKEKEARWGGGGVREMGECAIVARCAGCSLAASERDEGAACVPTRFHTAREQEALSG